MPFETLAGSRFCPQRTLMKKSYVFTTEMMGSSPERVVPHLSPDDGPPQQLVQQALLVTQHVRVQRRRVVREVQPDRGIPANSSFLT